MKYLNIKNTDLSVSNIVLGCMRIAGLEKPAINTLVHAAMEEASTSLTTPISMVGIRTQATAKSCLPMRCR